MEKHTIISGNQAFFCVAIGMAMFMDDFSSAVFQSFDEPVQYAIETREYSGYVFIDSTNIKNYCKDKKSAEEMRKSFANEINNRLIKKIAYDLPYSIKGELADKAKITVGIYRFNFKISKYERDGAHRFEMIKDPSHLPDKERLGRLVRLNIAMISSSETSEKEKL
jgi:hypothetical protein